MVICERDIYDDIWQDGKLANKICLTIYHLIICLIIYHLIICLTIYHHHVNLYEVVGWREDQTNKTFNRISCLLHTKIMMKNMFNLCLTIYHLTIYHLISSSHLLSAWKWEPTPEGKRRMRSVSISFINILSL